MKTDKKSKVKFFFPLPYLAFSKWCRILRLAVRFSCLKGCNIYSLFLLLGILYMVCGTLEDVGYLCVRKIPQYMTYMRTVSSIFLYFPTFVFSHLVFRDGAFCGRLTWCCGWITYATHCYNPLHSLTNLGSE